MMTKKMFNNRKTSLKTWLKEAAGKNSQSEGGRDSRDITHTRLLRMKGEVIL